MHNAPSVSFPVGRSRFMTMLSLLLWLAGLAAVVAWVVMVASPAWIEALALGAAFGVGGVAAWACWRQPGGLLVWDGRVWSWRDQALATGAAPVVVLDLQNCMLLRWPAAGPGPWLWLERWHDPGQWRAMRRAVYSRARTGLPTDGAADPATP